MRVKGEAPAELLAAVAAMDRHDDELTRAAWERQDRQETLLAPLREELERMNVGSRPLAAFNAPARFALLVDALDRIEFHARRYRKGGGLLDALYALAGLCIGWAEADYYELARPGAVGMADPDDQVGG